MELSQLRYFEAAARQGSMVAAAASCHVSQPALSVRIRALEEELGVPLLVRRPRGVTPTAAGEHVARVARRVLRELAQVRKDVRRRRLDPAPALRLGIQPFLASELLPEVARVWREAGAAVVVRERPQARLVEALLADEVDLAFLALPDRVPAGYEAVPLGRMGYGAFFTEGHPLARRRAVTLADLVPYEVILLQDSSGLESRFLQAAAAGDADPHFVFSGEQGMSVFELAAAGLGVALLPLAFARRAQRRRLRVIRVREPGLELTVGRLARTGRELPEWVDRALRTVDVPAAARPQARRAARAAPR